MNSVLLVLMILMVGAGIGTGVYFGVNYYLTQNRGTTSDPAIPPANNTAYNIELLLAPSVSPVYLPAIYRATDRWQRIINGSLPTQILLYRFEAEERCGFTFSASSRLVEDILIYIDFSGIDGPGGVLGSASWCVLDAARMPRVAYIRFDSGDLAGLLAAGTLESVVTHEMGHCLGIGTTWELKTTAGVYIRQLVTPEADPQPWYFTGPQAQVGEAEVSGQPLGPQPLVETAGGAGTARGHWLEGRYVHELMTGFITGPSQPLSVLTLRSLMDIGYQVNLSMADSFSVSRRRLRGSLVSMRGDTVSVPVYFAQTELEKNSTYHK